MITTALTAFAVSSVLLAVLVGVTQQERRRGRRFFAPGLRSWLDRVVTRSELSITRNTDHFVRYMVQLSWYYSMHKILRTVLRGLIAVYTYFEDKFERNRERAKELRAEKRQLHELNHLRQMAAHKVDTALTSTEQQKLRKDTLEGRM
ncbi:MAG: hypothetical protein KBC35_03885 [Candidatus Pacebacteria bacterium]|jgi:hypothetical protein|nr:hypothetical protein [Candidatus Paceibacterota bacterium]